MDVCVLSDRAALCASASCCAGFGELLQESLPDAGRLLRRITFLLLLIMPCSPVSAATLVAIVSERNAAEMAQAAAAFHERHAAHRLVFRTSAQIDALSNIELDRLLQPADSILITTVFKETARRLLPIVRRSNVPNVIALAGDPALGRASRWNGQRLFSDNDPRYDELSSLTDDKDASAEAVSAAAQKHPQLASWIRARGFWQNRNPANLNSLLALLLSPADATLAARIAPLQNPQTVRIRRGADWLSSSEMRSNRKLVAVLDDQHADQAGDVGDALCKTLVEKNLDCVTVFAGWGRPSREALEVLRQRVSSELTAIVSVQDFVVGGSSDRVAATRLLEQLNVPVFKAVRLYDVDADAWRLSDQGLSWDSVYYRVAMPELQGIGQPLVIAAAAKSQIDTLTGIALARVTALPAATGLLARRIARWAQLQTKKNADKHLALVYYNHPPGRHNIGADNLDVPASLLEILRALKAAGYDTGVLPQTPQALLERLQRDGVNLPEQGDALRSMATRVTTVSAAQYSQWFAQMPQALQQEMTGGPLALLASKVQIAQQARLPAEARAQVQRALGELKHLVEGAQHPARDRALDLVAQLQSAYEAYISGGSDAEQVGRLTRALIATGIEGLRGWGAAPGYVMVNDGRLVLPGIRFGKIFVGPQPPRGWELNEELLHANTSVPPTHQYLAFYFWLQKTFKADAIVHLGRHSTYEFLPRRSVGVGENDYSTVIAGDVPGIYPYIVDGVGEGLQAKRRGLAVMIDHLIPPLTATPLYDDLLRLRQLVESYEATNNTALRQQAAKAMRDLIDQLNLRDALAASMDAELKVRGIPFEQADDELLVHEIGHYLTRLQEDFMPLGLHVFGKPWSTEAVNTMMTSMRQGGGIKDQADVERNLKRSPAEEMRSLLQALSGHFVPAGAGNDPIRNPEALPTGRNFHGLDNSLIPSRLGYALGAQLAVDARKRVQPDGKEAVILWASDSVRDEGAMVAFGLALLGIEPVWNSRGIVSGLKRQPLDAIGVRADTMFVASGLFRDLFGEQIAWLDKAALLALDGSRGTIEREHPMLVPALRAALQPLGTMASGGDEPIARNHIAAHWIAETQRLLSSGSTPQVAGRDASLRVFGTAPGDYGAGINRLAERSGAWTDRKELAQAYLGRIGHAYRADGEATSRQDLLRSNLSTVRNTYLGRASNLYGLMDNNDAFDYLGGLSLAVETVSGRVPASYVAEHSNSNKPNMQPLSAALIGELRGRFLNPAWIKPLMQHGYAGARTIGSEFTEYLWGWQVTNPDIIKSWAWDEVKSVYLDDKYQLDVDRFLEQGANVHVKTNMMAILMVAAQKGYWQADEATLQQVAQAWADLLIQHGLPGSGHTRPDHPVFEWIMPRLREDQRQPLQQMLDKARVEIPKAGTSPSTLSEVGTGESTNARASELERSPVSNPAVWRWIALLALVLLLFAGGFVRGRYDYGRRAALTERA
jgi:cobaltochelatase CobN